MARVKAAGPPRRLPRPGARAAGGGWGAESRGSPARPALFIARFQRRRGTHPAALSLWSWESLPQTGCFPEFCEWHNVSSLRNLDCYCSVCLHTFPFPILFIFKRAKRILIQLNCRQAVYHAGDLLLSAA